MRPRASPAGAGAPPRRRRFGRSETGVSGVAQKRGASTSVSASASARATRTLPATLAPAPARRGPR
eukprot:15432541-Alexandrium_andersonii.AAC.1